MEIEKLPEFDNHELVSYFHDAKTGLRGYIAIHNTNRGPALGATRFWKYKSKKEAVRDVLRLSRGMTYKCALAGIPFGGGKGVIMADKKMKKTPAMISAYAKVLNSLDGKFYTGEDVGMNNKDVKLIAKETIFVIGKLPQKSDNPAYWAAFGVLRATQAALKEIFGNEEFRERTFVIKGLGKVGLELCRLIYNKGGKIIGADIDPAVIKKIKKECPQIKITTPGTIHKTKVDVFCPCALGGEFNSKNIKELRCKIICGGANNQLSEPSDGILLHKSGILYIPDYLANAGGLINVSAELRKGGYNRKWVEKKCLNIKKTASNIIALAKRNKQPTSVVADRLAEKMFNKVR